MASELGWRMRIVVQLQKLSRFVSSMPSVSVDFYNCNCLSFTSRIVGATSPLLPQPLNMCKKKSGKKIVTTLEGSKNNKYLNI